MNKAPTMTLKKISRIFRDFLTSEKTSNKNGFIQNLNSSIKSISIIILLIGLVWTNSSIFITTVLFFSLFLSRISGIPLRIHVKRFLLVSIFSFIIIFPQIFIMEGETLFRIAFFSISREGLIYVVRFYLRVTTSLSLISLLILSTDFSEILYTFRRIKFPEILISLISITYRYIFFFFLELNKVIIAKESRTFKEKDWKEEWRDLGKLVSNFFMRSIEKGERVNIAVRSRGGYGSGFSYKDKGIGLNDVVFLVLVFGFIFFEVVLWI